MMIISEEIISALNIPLNAMVNHRIPKKTLIENGSLISRDKQLVNECIDTLSWVAVLKPNTFGVPVFKDTSREYLEIVIIKAECRKASKNSRLAEIIHRSIQYPIFLILSMPGSLFLSLAHIRWSQSSTDTTVIDGSLVEVTISHNDNCSNEFIESLNLIKQPSQDTYNFYEGWINCFEAYHASRITGNFRVPDTANASAKLRFALVEYSRLTKQIANLRAMAIKQRQISKRISYNLQIKELESTLAKVASNL